MPKAAHTVIFDDGDDHDVLALVRSKNDDGTLNLITFPTTSPVEHENSVPEGEGGRSWREA